jgi:hypothetical protein
MANDFKRFTVPSVNTSAGASASAVYTVPSSGAQLWNQSLSELLYQTKQLQV